MVEPSRSVKRNVTVPVGRLAMHALLGIHEPPTPEAMFGGNPADSSEKTWSTRVGMAGRTPSNLPEPNGGIKVDLATFAKNWFSCSAAALCVHASRQPAIWRDGRKRCQFIPIRIGHAAVRLSSFAHFPLATVSVSQDIITALRRGAA
jgi:hypothetical protein